MAQTMFMQIPSPAAILGSIIPLLLLAIIAVILRFYTRRRLRQPLAVDDWLTLPALVLIFGLTFIMFYGIGTKTLAYPIAEDDDYLNGHIVVTARRLEYSFLPIFATTNGLVKLSVISFYRRIFTVDKSWRNARSAFFLVAMVLVGMWATAYTFAFMLPCMPDIQVYFVDPENWATKCVNTLMLGYSYAISDFITDILVILIPIPFIWRLHLSTSRKLAVLAVFSLGLVASAASLIRLIWIVWAQHMGFSDSTDEELMLTEELYWCLVEITLGLLASCLPTLRGLVKTKSVDSVVRSLRSMLSIGSGSTSTLEKSGDSYDIRASDSRGRLTKEGSERDVSITQDRKNDAGSQGGMV
ncbi:hypothetical protein BCR34DRAFT_582383 [Clohesyomyces aquaticus]|uniref:Rhodopsin domain-containing protein n=1 Tax=Clohesyomyces aquaticus TaxID=1231657 RepID=A0A1Y2A9J4_9PLEO|nr:hypothetical protein BCR34DRAFT_582383 [Clohesyomyces aquaticus]